MSLPTFNGPAGSKPGGGCSQQSVAQLDYWSTPSSAQPCYPLAAARAAGGRTRGVAEDAGPDRAEPAGGVGVAHWSSRLLVALPMSGFETPHPFDASLRPSDHLKILPACLP